MTVAGFDPSTDFETIADGLEAVTLDRRGSSDNVSVTKALRRNVSTTEIAASNGKLQSGDTRWHLPASEVTTTPRLGDWIEDSSGDRWQVLEIRKDTLSNRWRCISRNLRIVYGLDDTVTIQVASYAKGTAGAPERTYTTWRTGVRCRVQEVAATHGDEAGARRTQKAYVILCEDDYDLDHTHRIKDRRGNKYQVLGVSQRADIGKPMIIEATPWR
jgi:hypothetical protein